MAYSSRFQAVRSACLDGVMSMDFFQAIKNPNIKDAGVFSIKSLTMTYSRMGKCHTTIGAGLFHF